MQTGADTQVRWVILTMGDRQEALAEAISSVADDGSNITVVSNGAGPLLDVDRNAVDVVEAGNNRGVPGGRDFGVAATTDDVVAFLDDDAVAPEGVTARIREEFDADSRLGAVALRLVDEQGDTSRRHVPRLGGKGADEPGEVALFLGGACAIRREAYIDVGGYFTELFYGHEELELSWRLIDGGWTIRYLADVEVFHPRTTIERHAEGWELTGRNRVLIARRSLPWLVAFVHTGAWLALGIHRAPRGASRRRYVTGWRSGWTATVDHKPIRWRTVWRLTRCGRPPFI